MRSFAGRILWVGRATVFLVGLAVILAVVFGLASAALGANGNPFLLGRENVASQVSRLVKNGPGPALKLVVQDGQSPLAVNSSGKVANLNADRLDGKNETDFYAAGSKVDDSDLLDGEDLGDVLPGGDLPSGATIRGTYNMYDEAHIAGDATSGAISFVYTLASTPTVDVIEQGDPLTTDCPQRGDDFLGEVPEAAPGYLCIYEWDESNELNGSGYPFITNTNRTGTGITVRSETTGIFYSEGVWAVTAP